MTDQVVPRVGTWVEIQLIPPYVAVGLVVPRVGTWVEIQPAGARKTGNAESSPAWGRGLKLV